MNAVESRPSDARLDGVEHLVESARNCVASSLGPQARVDAISLLERRSEWDTEGFQGYATEVTLRSGLHLVISEARAERFIALPTQTPPGSLVFVLSRGTGVAMKVDGVPPYLSGAGSLEVSRVRETVTMTSELAPGAHNEFLVLQLTAERLVELLGVNELPTLIERVQDGTDAFSRATVPMNTTLFRLLDELLHCASEGVTRQLYLEGKALEVLARVVEAFHRRNSRRRQVLPVSEVARLQDAKRHLVEHLDAPPSLVELSKRAGMNQTKLKEGFRNLFGMPIYAYLRERRLTTAHRLLDSGEHTVTEVAARVGYVNASKFASAFRKRFGVAPSALR